MKRTVWNVTLASVVTLVAYIALSAILMAIANSIEDRTLKVSVISLITSIAYGAILLYISKIRTAAGEDEVSEDYGERDYRSLWDDLKIVLRREMPTFVCIATIAVICFAVNGLDAMISGKKTFSAPFIIFAPLCLFDSAVELPFVGYALSAILDFAFYAVFLLIYRKRKYVCWRKK